MINVLISIGIGIVGGIYAGLLGTGGAVIIIPLLVYILKFSQHLAQGTSLAALLPPIGILGFLTYYKLGYANIKIGMFLAIGIFIGAFIGAKIATALPGILLRKIFASVLICIGIHMLLTK